MSWFWGIVNNGKCDGASNHPLQKDCLLNICEKNLLIRAGGNAKTLFHKIIDENTGWLVIGVGIAAESGGFTILEKQQWVKILDADEFLPENIGGHFIVIKWSKEKIKFYTDRTGLRDFYSCRCNDKILFSTRLDWLKDSASLEIDFSEFGSRWLLFNQLSTNSVAKNVTRIICGEILNINRHTLKTEIKKSSWISEVSCNGSKYDKHSYSELLEKLILLHNDDTMRAALSLSGGMDSRVLLSYLIKNNSAWDSHTFGSADSTDYKIVEKLAHHFNIRNQLLNMESRDFKTTRQEMEEYIAQSVVNNSASMIVPLRNYELLKPLKDNVVIDGGFGEIWRREFLARLYFKGKSALVQKDLAKIISFMRLYRADIFTKEINSLMLEGCKVQLEKLFDELPPVNKIGIENWIDALAIKTRLPNYYGHEQARLDSMIVSYMPFIQPALLEKVFLTPVRLRKNARLYKQIIKGNAKGLANIGLAKGSFTHPFFLSTLQTRLWNLAVKKFGGSVPTNSAAQFFFPMMKEYINDLCSSLDFKTCGLYNTAKVEAILSQFNENGSRQNEVDWLLAFEIFRRKIG